LDARFLAPERGKSTEELRVHGNGHNSAEEEPFDSDSARAHRSKLVNLNLPDLLAKIKETHQQKKQCLRADDFPGALICKMQLRLPLSELAMHPLCRGCLVKFPSKIARNVLQESWLGNPCKKTQFPFCRFCGPGAQDLLTAKEWCQDAIESSLKRRASHYIRTAYMILEKSHRRKDSAMAALRKRIRASKVAQGRGKGLRSKGTVPKVALVGELIRTLRRCLVEVKLQPQCEILQQLLEQFGAD